jgi:hypothetical protein
MTIEVPRLLVGYARAMRVGGMALAAIVLATDHRWLEKPAACLILLGAVLVVRAAPVRLSKYSYLTQTGIPVLAGAITVGPTPVVFALATGVFACDLLWLRKHTASALVNAGREVIAFVGAFGVYAVVLRLSGNPTLSLDFLPAGFTLAAMYFLTSRALFYFTLLLRSKLESVESGITTSLFAIWGSGAHDIWAGGEDGTLIHYGPVDMPTMMPDGGTGECSPQGYGCMETPCCSPFRCTSIGAGLLVCA